MENRYRNEYVTPKLRIDNVDAFVNDINMTRQYLERYSPEALMDVDSYSQWEADCGFINKIHAMINRGDLFSQSELDSFEAIQNKWIAMHRRYLKDQEPQYARRDND